MSFFFFFFFNDTATTEIYTLSLHDALPISVGTDRGRRQRCRPRGGHPGVRRGPDAATAPSAPRHRQRSSRRLSPDDAGRSEEHTSELQSRLHLVCRLLLEKKKKNKKQVVST